VLREAVSQTLLINYFHQKAKKSSEAFAVLSAHLQYCYILCLIAFSVDICYQASL